MCLHSAGLQIILFLVTVICPPGQHLRREGGGGRGVSRFQVTGMIKGYLWVWNFQFWDCFGSENLAIFWGGQLDLSRDFFGYSKHLKFVVVPAFPGCKQKHSEHAYEACTLCSWCLDLWWMDRFHSFFVIVVCSTVNSSNLTISNVSCSLEGIYICSPVNNISNAENGPTSGNVTGKRSKSFKKTGLYVYASDRVHYTVNLKT